MKTLAWKLIAAIAVCLGVLLAFNLVLLWRLDSVPRLMIRELRNQPRVDVLFLGNSLMAGGLNLDTFRSNWPVRTKADNLYNAALSASTTVEQDLLARESFRRHGEIKYVVYGFFDDQLTYLPRARWTDLEGNMSMAYYVEPEIGASYYFPPEALLNRACFRAVGWIPMLREHSQLWKYVERWRRTCSELGMPAVKTNRFGRANDFQKLLVQNPAIFSNICDEVVAHATPFAPPVEEIFDLATKHGAKIYMVEMPVPSKHRRDYYETSGWRKYQNYLHEKFKARGIEYIEASDWVKDDQKFLDHLHLNEDGAKRFSQRLAAELAGQIKP